MIDWPVMGGNIFVGAAAVSFAVAPIYGGVLHERRLRAMEVAALLISLAAFGGALAASWRHVSSGPSAAATGTMALAISAFALVQIGRAIRSMMSDRLGAALIGLLVGIGLTIGPFAAGPLAAPLSLGESTWLLVANPLVTTSSAAGIDFLHLDLIYRISPLAHRGVALPAWTTVSAAYAVVGLTAYGASRLRPWSR